MKFIALKLSDGSNKRKLAFYCRLLKVSRQGFYDYRKRQGRPWKHEALANIMLDIVRQTQKMIITVGGECMKR